MATTWIKALHKGGSIASALNRSADYVKDKSKTEDGELVDSYECQPYTAQSEFLLSKKLYAQKTGRDQGKHDVIAYHIRMSFMPGEVTAEKALELGRELALRWTRGKHQFIVAAHTNTNNPHVHIIYNSVTLDCDRKFQDFKRSAIVLRRVSDQVCLEYGLSVIENPGLSKGNNRAEYLSSRDSGEDNNSARQPSVRDQLRDIIDMQLAQIISAQETASQSEQVTSPQNTTSLFENFIAAMKNVGCEVKRGKHLAFKIPGGQRLIRCKSLGEDYVESALLERLAGTRIVKPKENSTVLLPTELLSTESSTPPIETLHQQSEQGELEPPQSNQPTIKSQPTFPSLSVQKPQSISPPTTSSVPSQQLIQKPNLLIDIQAKLQKAHSPGFEHFARIYNLKEMAKTLLFLQERGLTSYDTFIEKSDVVVKSFNKRSGRIKEIEAKQKEISELQRHIGAYGKTKDTYATYRQLKNEEQSTWHKFRNKEHPADLFYDSNRANITLHESAKKYFDAQGYGRGTGKKLPTIKSLQIEYAKLEAERKKLWTGHKTEREEMIALKMAKQNVDMFLSEPSQRQQTKTYRQER